MDIFTEKLEAFFAEFGVGRKMVLSTCESGKPSSRMMSVVRIGGDFFFQTDVTLRKYRQLTACPNAALCIDNIQIEGSCTELGRPRDNAAFCEAFRQCFKGSFDAYTSLENERLFVLRPSFIERWVYVGKTPFIEAFDLPAREYSFTEYKGV